MSTMESRKTGRRAALHRAGFRFRLHYRSLPGTPDLVFPGRKKVIFVPRVLLASPQVPEGIIEVAAV